KVVDGQYDIGIPEVMGRLGDMITELRRLVSSLNIMASDTTMAKFSRTVNNVEQLTSSLAAYVERNENKLDRTADNFLRASGRLGKMLNRNADLVDSTAARFDRVSRHFEDFVLQLDSISASARRFADVLETEEGTVQLLLEDRRLYDDLRQTADNIDDLITDIRENPSKYISLKLELF
ncbi:MAG: hypothetical protein JSU65_06560, partial [Candidatus Zixiibacteriota bacterium]